MTRAPGPCRSCEGAFRDAIDGYAMCGGCNTVYIQNYRWRVADQTEIAHMPSATMPDKSPGHRGASADPGGVFTPTESRQHFRWFQPINRECALAALFAAPVALPSTRCGRGGHVSASARPAGSRPWRRTRGYRSPSPQHNHLDMPRAIVTSTLQAPPAEAEGSR
jgi:hypothetical protein